MNAPTSQPFEEGKLLGDSQAIVDLRKVVNKVGKSKSRAIILGECGTGKELVAWAIHKASSQADGPFEAINCAAVPESLIESELFGYERGAFTGATSKKEGRFELANGGTLFLDEIGDMAFGMQAKLLRVLQDGSFQRIGGKSTIFSSARIVTATNRDLRADVVAGRFRADLYYRLSVLPVVVPPLRERLEDVPMLAQTFLARTNRSHLRLSKDALDGLKQYHWPGNVRELINIIERVTVLAQDDASEISFEDVMVAIDLDEAFGKQRGKRQ